MKIDLYTTSGEKKGAVEVKEAMFQAPVNNELMRLALVRQQAHIRRSTANTKRRGEIRGGGHKPRPQKGSGHSRQGSTRSPLWPGGGITFGPLTERNYTQRMSKQSRRQALFSALSQKTAEDGVFALEVLKLDKPKTKTFAQLMSKLPVKRSLLVVLSEKNLPLEKSISNIPNAKTILVDYLNVLDLLKYEKVAFLEPSIQKAEELFLN